jgi:hypothetical protein
LTGVISTESGRKARADKAQGNGAEKKSKKKSPFGLQVPQTINAFVSAEPLCCVSTQTSQTGYPMPFQTVLHDVGTAQTGKAKGNWDQGF